MRDRSVAALWALRPADFKSAIRFLIKALSVLPDKGQVFTFPAACRKALEVRAGNVRHSLYVFSVFGLSPKQQRGLVRFQFAGAHVEVYFAPSTLPGRWNLVAEVPAQSSDVTLAVGCGNMSLQCLHTLRLVWWRNAYRPIFY